MILSISPAPWMGIRLADRGCLLRENSLGLRSFWFQGRVWWRASLDFSSSFWIQGGNKRWSKSPQSNVSIKFNLRVPLVQVYRLFRSFSFTLNGNIHFPNSRQTNLNNPKRQYRILRNKPVWPICAFPQRHDARGANCWKRQLRQGSSRKDRRKNSGLWSTCRFFVSTAQLMTWDMVIEELIECDSVQYLELQ